MTSQDTAGPLRTRSGPAAVAWRPPDARRWLQLGLAVIWIIDGVLQYQPVMFSRSFGQMLAASTAGNPGWIADSITWSARIVEHNPAWTNAAFATIQLALGLGLAWRPTIKAALAASVAWSVAVWWFGEGLGGVLGGGSSPVNDAPGAVILYALIAVLLWPAASARDAGGAAEPFVAARPAGVPVARVLWLVLWGSLAYFAVLPGNRTASGLHDMIAGMADGEPGWLASLDRSAASALAGRGLAVSIALAVVFGLIAIGVFLPRPALRGTVVLAIIVSGLIWVVGEDLGEILVGGATDVNTGPLLALIALAYWPLRARSAPGSGSGWRAGPAVGRAGSLGSDLAPSSDPGRGSGPGPARGAVTARATGDEAAATW
jgi:hypothetical protein